MAGFGTCFVLAANADVAAVAVEAETEPVHDSEDALAKETLVALIAFFDLDLAYTLAALEYGDADGYIDIAEGAGGQEGLWEAWAEELAGCRTED